ncbi:hypothetical protein GPJ61_10755 [Brevibacillus formosus]|uniref:hypothetical protein n=1 Tax=Brevibacillus formosus TaxID=54913 RepID=UPI001CA484E7|nr:hypothetical protein [Brevibacillus formosus]MBW5468335.1 hypothetical protein [Brevibacillus formosus]
MNRYYLNNFYIGKISLEERIKVMLSFLNQGDIFLFFHTKDHFEKHCTPQEKEFIGPRIRFINNEWVFPWGTQPLQNNSLVWYEINDSNEVKESLGINNLFTCLVIQKNDEFMNHAYVLSLRESVDSFVLIIDEKRKGDFMGRVFPKIKCYFTEEVKLASKEEIYP